MIRLGFHKSRAGSDFAVCLAGELDCYHGLSTPYRIPRALYHVTARGNAQQDIFLDDEDQQQFLWVLARVVFRFHLLLHAYCLLDNHFHLVVETPDGNLSKAMRQLDGVYT